MKEAVETVDSARQHIYQLEEKRKLLKTAINQVECTAELSRKNVCRYFEDLKTKLCKACELQVENLIEEIDSIEQEALNPLLDCQALVQEGIDEAEIVANSGEQLIHNEVDSQQKQLKKFTDMANSIALDSVPEVPALTEVVNISAQLDVDVPEMICKTIIEIGSIDSKPPLQIVNLEARPGGILVSWMQLDDEGTSIESDFEDSILYKLQSCVGTPTIHFKDGKADRETANFKDEYIGEVNEYFVSNVSPNTIYTFRVCACKCKASNDGRRLWSPWSVYQTKMTTMAAHKWSITKENNKYYSLSNRNRSIQKIFKNEVVAYTEPSKYLLSFPITLRIDSSGESLGKNDCFVVCCKRDLSATNLHLRDGTFCFHSDGSVWVNGKMSKTRFSNFHRSMQVCFLITQEGVSGQQGCRKPTNSTIYKVSISIANREAVFLWKPFASYSSVSSFDFCLGVFFKYAGWKVTII